VISIHCMQVLRSYLKPVTKGLALVPAIDLVNHASAATVRWSCSPPHMNASTCGPVTTHSRCCLFSQAEYDFDQHRGRFAMKIGEDGIRAGAYVARVCLRMLVLLKHTCPYRLSLTHTCY